MIPANPENFIAFLREPALDIQEEYDIPAAVIIAQAALESGWGKHTPKDRYTGRDSKNFFGIKHHGSNHPFVTSTTREYVNGEWVETEARFRAYVSWSGSMADYAAFLMDNPRYQRCFMYSDDPERFAEELQVAGYATDPEYADKLKGIMRQWDLLELSVPGPVGPAPERRRTLKDRAVALLFLFVERFLRSISNAIWTGTWSAIFEAIEYAEEKWEESGHGEDKKEAAVQYVLDFLKLQGEIGWIRRQLVRVFVGQIIDYLIAELNKEFGQDWVETVKAYERDLADMLAFID